MIDKQKIHSLQEESISKVQKFREEVERLKSQLLRGACSSQVAMETRCKEEAYNEVLSVLDTMPDEPISEDLEEAVNAYIGYAPEVDESSSTYGKRQAFKAGAQWQKQKDSMPINKDFEEVVKTLWKDVKRFLAEIHRVCDITDEHGYRIELRELQARFENYMKGE